MNPLSKRATTLVEILIAIILFSMIMFGVYNLQLFSDNQVVLASRKSVLQREGAYVLEHMSKQFLHAVSNGRTYPVDLEAGNKLRVWVDTNGDGRLQDHLDSTHDTLSYYRTDAGGNISYCASADWSTYPGAVACNAAEEKLGTHITTMFDSSNVLIDTNTTYITVNLSACWKPSESATCGSLRNPKVMFKNRIPMPAAATNAIGP